jgi:hypothetical protein
LLTLTVKFILRTLKVEKTIEKVTNGLENESVKKKFWGLKFILRQKAEKSQKCKEEDGVTF